jgi:phosphopantetheinyl transferase
LRYLQHEDRLRSLSAGLLLYHCLGIRDDEELIIGSYGRPELKVGHPCFSLSHSGLYAGLSVASDPHGLDLENLSREMNFELIAKRIFREDEYYSFKEGNFTPLFFFSIFTRKESLMKASGEGFKLDPSTFSVLPLESESLKILGNLWHFKTLLMDNHIFTLASPGSPIELTQRDLEVEKIQRGIT